LDIVEINQNINAAVVSRKRLHSAQVWADHILLRSKKDKITTVEAPWKKYSPFC
jgi:hypothetical protein